MSEEDALRAPSGITNGSTSNGQNGNSEKKPEHKHSMGAAKEKLTEKQQKIKDKNNPPGGYDQTPIPPARDGYIVRFTFHRAENLPVSDLNSFSSDPYIHATLTSALRKRHKEDPDLILRTPTMHKKTDPVWNYQWTVAGVPSSGFRLKCRLYDEDPSDHDDRLGNVTVYVSYIDKEWTGIKEDAFDIKKRMGSKRAYLIRGCAAMLNSNVHMGGRLYLSMEVLGESEPPHGRMFTLGEVAWTKHFSPMIGRMAGTKAPGSSEEGEEKKTEKYDFQANQFQLQGPIPPELYHRFVEFKPFVKGMFSKAGLRGRLLNKALHHQHAHIYNFSTKTEWGIVEPKSEAASLQFLKMVHYDEGGRIFTYVLTLDGLLRFTETGKEFGIDLLSKHTMHSDVNIYIACSGEFFIRRLKNPDRHTDDPEQETHPGSDIPGGPPESPPPENPRNYELVIDNDSGTYRPDGSILPLLKKFLKANFPGLHIVTKECTDDKLTQMKKQQTERKKKEGKNIQLVQDSDGEISSSDEEALGRAGKKTKRQRAYQALEDPKKAVRDLIPGEVDKKEREEREEQGDKAESYPSEAVSKLLTHLDVSGQKNARIIDLACGTGKFTELLARRLEEYEVIAVEPHDGMRRELVRKDLGGNVKVLAGNAGDMPIKEGWGDALVAAQAFHWFANEETLREVHRVLRPGATFGMIWNVDDYNSPKDWSVTTPWEQTLKDMIASLEDGQPRFRHLVWNQVFENQLDSTPLQPLRDTFKHQMPQFSLPLGEENTKWTVWLTDEAIWARYATLSQIANLEGEKMGLVKKQVFEALKGEGTERNEKGEVGLHGITYFAWTSRI